MDQPESIASNQASAPETVTTQPDHGSDTLRFLAEALRTILIVFGLAYVLRVFVLQPFVVEGSSMHPRFETHDYLIVDKLSYRFGTPQRGDIVVFRYPNDPSTNYVKRIIGLPGERVRIEDGKITIFNSEHPDGFVLDEHTYLDDDVRTTLPISSRNEYTITPDTYFVLGDNRRASSDSREWGLLPNENIVGRVVLQAYPLERSSIVTHARYNNS